MISDTGTRRPATSRTERERSTFRDALWLAKRDIRSSWASFPATAGVALLFGFVGVAQYRNALVAEPALLGQVILDFFLVAVVAILSSNLLLNQDYFRDMGVAGFNGRLSFFRSLPVSAMSVVLGRLATMLLSLACAAPPFFLAPYLIYDGLSEFIGFGAYVWYVGMWLGYALLATGCFIVSSFTINWRAESNWQLKAVAVVAVAYTLIIVASNLLFADGLSLTLIEVAKSAGPLAAALSLVIGASALTLCVRVAATRLRGRDIG